MGIPIHSTHSRSLMKAHEQASRQARLRAEILQSHKEQKQFINNVERSKRVNYAISKQREEYDSRREDGEETESGKQGRGEIKMAEVRPEMRIRQNYLQKSVHDKEKSGKNGGKLDNVLGKVFG
jgi:hypothetical protein